MNTKYILRPIGIVLMEFASAEELKRVMVEYTTIIFSRYVELPTGTCSY